MISTQSITNTDSLLHAGRIREQFVKRAFKRAHSPLHNEDLLISTLAQASITNNPIQFVMYWGKGMRDWAGDLEARALEHLRHMFADIQSIHLPGCSLTIIATDTHIKLNGYHKIAEYFDSVKALANSKGFPVTLVYMSDIASLPTLEEMIDRAAHSNIAPELLKELTHTAKKHSKVIKDPQLAAKVYFTYNQIEKVVVADRYPDHIFLSYNSNSYLDLLPEKLPIFFMSSIRRATTAKPWY